MLKVLPCKNSEIQLLFTLTGGQCFRWKESAPNEWTGVFAHKVWVLSQNEDSILYSTTGSNQESKNSECLKNKRRKRNPITKTSAVNGENNDLSGTEDELLLKQYFRLNENLANLYEQWSECDPHFKEAAVKFQGVRILDQDPVENLFSFICSSNNNISRISSMVEKLCSFYGREIVTIGEKTFYDFPSVSALAEPSVEEMLRKNGFGYRAKYIYKSACKIMEMGGEDWLHNLKTLPYEEAKAELIKLPGIGAKVADCICLMSLGHLNAIPVDTHIFQVAVQRYLPHLKNCKSVTDKVYNEIGIYFRQLYGSYAGWAHTILFCADLKMFQDKTVSEKRKNENGEKRAKKCR